MTTADSLYKGLRRTESDLTGSWYPDIPADDSQYTATASKTVEKKLHKLGLYTLNPDSPHFIKSYQENMEERDKVYHNGAPGPIC
jgi:hypothetical protein